MRKNESIIHPFFQRVLLKGIVIFLIFFYIGGLSMADEKAQARKHFVLLGASVGKAWNITEISDRVKNTNYSFEYIGLYQFDKSSALNQLLRRTEKKPDAIILKECAAYFPSDITFEKAKSLMKRWIKQSLEKGITPIPATIAPVTRSRDERYKTHNPVKRVIKKMLGISMMTQMERIIEYNDWIKEYSKERGLVVLDLEAPLRISDTNRYMRDDLTKGDGLHLNEKAYKILDDTLIRTLQKVKFHTEK